MYRCLCAAPTNFYLKINKHQCFTILGHDGCDWFVCRHTQRYHHARVIIIGIIFIIVIIVIIVIATLGTIFVKFFIVGYVIASNK